MGENKKYLKPPPSLPTVTNHFRYRKWRYENLYKLYGCKAYVMEFPTPPNSLVRLTFGETGHKGIPFIGS